MDWKPCNRHPLQNIVHHKLKIWSAATILNFSGQSMVRQNRLFDALLHLGVMIRHGNTQVCIL